MKKISRIRKAWERNTQAYNLDTVLLWEWAKGIAGNEIRRFPTPKQTIRRLKKIYRNRENKKDVRYCTGSHEMLHCYMCERWRPYDRQIIIPGEREPVLNPDFKCKYFTPKKLKHYERKH